MFSVAPNIVLVPNTTQNTERRTQDAERKHSSYPASPVSNDPQEQLKIHNVLFIKTFIQHGQFKNDLGRSPIQKKHSTKTLIEETQKFYNVFIFSRRNYRCDSN